MYGLRTVRGMIGVCCPELRGRLLSIGHSSLSSFTEVVHFSEGPL